MPHSTPRHRRFFGAIAVATTVLLAAAGCSSSGDSSADATTTTAPSTCDSMQALSTAMTSLVSEETVAGGKAGIESALADVQTAFDQVKTSASSDFGDDVDALSQALDELSTAVSGLTSGDGLVATVSAIGTAANQTVAAYGTLATDVSAQSSDCDLTTPSTIAG